MGLLDWLAGNIQCPRCGMKGAKESASQIRCPNPSCPNFDPSLARRGGFAPARPFAIRYRNFQGQERIFTADAESAERKNNHILVRVAPKGVRIALSRDRIQNLSEVESAIPQRAAPEPPGPPGPTPRERQVLAYHKSHKTSSPLYEKIRSKYPNW